MVNYKPKQGDIILLNFTPQSGHEQMGQRPGLVVSSDFFNEKINMALVCPITMRESSFPLHVKLNSKTKTQGYIMCEQLKSLDVDSREAIFLEKAPGIIVKEVLEIIESFLKE
jgi:mRNA interferase MazF